jgi:phosphoribosylformylglycinamidine synthase
VAHKEGRLLVRDPGVLARLREEGQIALRYIDPRDPRAAAAYPGNPNGAVDAIAGITNPRGNVLGLMPHPERHRRRLHDPHWTRAQDAVRRLSPGEEERGGDGFAFFANAVEHARREWLPG